MSFEDCGKAKPVGRWGLGTADVLEVLNLDPVLFLFFRVGRRRPAVVNIGRGVNLAHGILAVKEGSRLLE